jgi:hypothetical protein
LLVVGLHRLDPKLANVAYARVSYDAGELLALAAAGARALGPDIVDHLQDVSAGGV